MRNIHPIGQITADRQVSRRSYLSSLPSIASGSCRAKHFSWDALNWPTNGAMVVGHGLEPPLPRTSCCRSFANVKIARSICDDPKKFPLRRMRSTRVISMRSRCCWPASRAWLWSSFYGCVASTASGLPCYPHPISTLCIGLKIESRLHSV
jgi:hypothetical protein